MRYVFRVSRSKNTLDSYRQFTDTEYMGRPPSGVVRITLDADGYDIPCSTPPEFWGMAEDVERVKEWLLENDSTPPPGRIHFESCTPRQIYWPLHSPDGRAAWSWEIESDDESTDFDAPPAYPSTDDKGNVILY